MAYWSRFDHHNQQNGCLIPSPIITLTPHSSKLVFIGNCGSWIQTFFHLWSCRAPAQKLVLHTKANVQGRVQWAFRLYVKISTACWNTRMVDAKRINLWANVKNRFINTSTHWGFIWTRSLAVFQFWLDSKS